MAAHHKHGLFNCYDKHVLSLPINHRDFLVLGLIEECISEQTLTPNLIPNPNVLDWNPNSNKTFAIRFRTHIFYQDRRPDSLLEDRLNMDNGAFLGTTTTLS